MLPGLPSQNFVLSPLGPMSCAAMQAATAAVASAANAPPSNLGNLAAAMSPAAPRRSTALGPNQLAWCKQHIPGFVDLRGAQ